MAVSPVAVQVWVFAARLVQPATGECAASCISYRVSAVALSVQVQVTLAVLMPLWLVAVGA